MKLNLKFCIFDGFGVNKQFLNVFQIMVNLKLQRYFEKPGRFLTVTIKEI
jgi:hypothetical protein